MNAARLTILRALRNGPAWSRSFHAAKATYAAMAQEGLIERVKPPNGKAANMLRITAKGRAALDAGDA